MKFPALGLLLTLVATPLAPHGLAQTPPRLTSYSIRHGVGTGSGALISNFIIDGANPKTVLIRAVGPTLGSFGITGVLADPILTIHDRTGTVIAENNDWVSTPALTAAFVTVGAFSLTTNSRDAVLLLTLNPGFYSARVAGVANTTGLVLLEINETDNTSRFSYFASRGAIGSGNSSMAAGFSLGGTGSDPTLATTLLVRALGAKLGSQGVAGVMDSPSLTLFRGGSALLAGSNDAWSSPTLSNAAASVGLLPLLVGSRDSAVLAPVPIGPFTAVVSASIAGLGMLEISVIDAVRSNSFPPALLVPPTEIAPAFGSTAILSAAALGNPTPTYRWLKNGAAISGATQSSFALINFQASDAGNYSVVMTNFAGTTVSSNYVVSAPVTLAITTPPLSQAAVLGGAVTFVVTASGTPAPTYQWLRNGATLAGATNATLTISNVQAGNLGTYSVRVTNTQGSVTSAGAELTVATPPVITLQPTETRVAAGGTATFTVAASGTPPLLYQWRRNGSVIPSATGASLSVITATTADSASYTCVVSNEHGTAASAPAALTVVSSARLINLSLLTHLNAPGDGFTLGYVVGGRDTTGVKPLVIRAAGPSLSALGVPDALDDPKLELFAGSAKTLENDNWGGSPALLAAFDAVGAFRYSAPNSKDAAVVTDIASADNSVRVSAAGNGTGAVIAEIYDATPNASYTLTSRRLLNVSALKEVGPGFTLGFVLGGSGSKSVLIRAVGPGLASVGVTSGTVGDPTITLFAGATKLDENDNWGGTATITAATSQVGAFAIPATSKDAVLLATLQPGQYSVQVGSAGGATGLVLVEVYDVP